MFHDMFIEHYQGGSKPQTVHTKCYRINETHTERETNIYETNFVINVMESIYIIIKHVSMYHKFYFINNVIFLKN